MRIAYVVGSFPFVSETFVVNEIVGIAARGHIVDIFTTVDSQVSGISEGVSRYNLQSRTHRIFGSPNYFARFFEFASLVLTTAWRVPSVVWRAASSSWRHGIPGGLWLLFAGLRIVRLGTRDYDVIHAQFGTCGLIALGLKETGAIRGPIVTSFRGFDVTKALKDDANRYQRLFCDGSLFLPVSKALGRRLTDAGCAQRKLRVHHSGIDCRKLLFTPRRPEKNRTRIISVARLMEKKGIRHAIEAVAELASSARSVQYTIVGDGPLRAELERLVETLGIASTVTFSGWKSHDDVLRLLETSHILVAPSITGADGDEEGIPNSAKEAMALGLPVVSTIHGGIPELIEDGVSGFLVPERDSQALANRLAYLIDRPQAWADIGAAARRRIETEFDMEKLNDELVSLYREVASQQPQVHRSSTN